MRKLTLLTIIILVSLTAFSQIGTKNTTTDSSILLPKNVAVEVAKDLIRKDSCETELDITKKNLDLTIENNKLKDSVILSKNSEIALYKEKEKNYELIIKYNDQKYDNLKLSIEPLKKDLKTTKRTLNATRVGAGAIILFLSYIILRK